tara:strand:+ start:21198 stop:21686 length:489 start_codon:yes stop_codon:yes gene_type:complete
MKVSCYLITDDYQVDLHYYRTYSITEEPISIKNVLFKNSTHSDIDGTLNYNGNVFYLIEGSYLNTEKNSGGTENSNFENLFYNSNPVMEMSCTIEFVVNNSDYHFNLLLNGIDLEYYGDGSKIINEYYLLNSNNKKIGIIKYTIDRGSELFQVLDVNRNLVE